MIRVQDLTKRYAGRTAIDRLSFEVEKGEIVGFLGPNGAGKSTTLRILTCYLSATSGRASVAGFDTYRQSREVRRRIGYMPENVPLYEDMRAEEYLRFRAELKGLRGSAAKRAVGEAMDICSLQEVRRKLIGNLSKGFRQRVGLADALVNKPDLLILDEPTNGLDPNQIRQARELIRRLGERHTILVSTHILPEVEMTCSRVIILDRGRIQASDTPENLVRRLRAAGTVDLEIRASTKQALPLLRGVEGVRAVSTVETRGEWSRFEIRTESQSDLREDLYALVVERKWPLRELSQRRASLEDVFVDITHPAAKD